MTRYVDILIENYNTDEKKFELGKQKISNITFKKFKNLLKEIPIESPITNFPVKIIRKESSIRRIKDPDYSKSDREYCQVNYLASKKVFLKTTEKKVEIKELLESDLYRSEFSDLTLKQKLKAIIKISTIFYYFSIALFAYIFILLGYLTALSLFFLILWSWLVVLSIFDFIATVLELRKDIISRDKDLIYFIPIINEFKTYNFLKLFIRSAISYGALTFLLLGLLLPELRIQFEKLNIYIFFILIIILASLVLKSSSSILQKYLKQKSRKTSILRNFNKFIQETSLDWKVKQYYLKLIIEIKNRHLINIGFFSKFITILTFFLATIPPITELYF